MAARTPDLLLVLLLLLLMCCWKLRPQIHQQGKGGWMKEKEKMKKGWRKKKNRIRFECSQLEILKV